MNKIKAFFKNEFYFKIAYILVMIISVVQFIDVAYDPLMIGILLWGLFLLFDFVFLEKSFVIAENIWGLAFMAVYGISILVNLKNLQIRELPVILSTCIHLFLLARVKKGKNSDDIQKEIYFIARIISFCMFVFSFIALFMFVAKFSYQINHNLVGIFLRSNSILQVRGIFNTQISTGLYCVIGVMCNIYILSYQCKVKTQCIKRVMLFACISLLVTFLYLVLANVLTAYLIFLAFFAVICFFFYRESLKKTKAAAYKVLHFVLPILLMAISCVLLFSCMKQLRTTMIKIFYGNAESLVLQTSAIDAIDINPENFTDRNMMSSIMNGSSGRFEIWKAMLQSMDLKEIAFGRLYKNISIAVHFGSGITIKYLYLCNGFLTIFVSIGIGGLLLAVAFIVKELWSYFWQILKKENKTLLFLFASLLAFMLYNFSMSSLLLARDIVTILICIYFGYSRRILDDVTGKNI